MKMTQFNTYTMAKIQDALAYIPEGYAVKRESIQSIELDADGDIVEINFPATKISRVYLFNSDCPAWQFGNTVFTEKNLCL